MSTLVKVPRNLKGRDFVVGDLHGHLPQLQRQLEDIQFRPGSDRLFFVGDLVDRGPDSAGVLDLIDQRTYISIIGNHEAMMIAGLEDKRSAYLHLLNGGGWFYEIPEERQRAIVARVRTWPWVIEIDTGDRRAGLVHGNVPESSWAEVLRLLRTTDEGWQSGAPLSATAIDDAARSLLWNRSLVLRLYSDILSSDANQRAIAEFMVSRRDGMEWIAEAAPQQLSPFQISGIDAVYMGHTYVPTPIQVGKCHFLDTYRGEPGEKLGIVCINNP